ncbi:MAG: TetR/AcrR family transcriptional regulator, partial [Pseudomonas sp.]
VMLSRACPDDSALADEILQACCAAALARLG